MLSVAALLVHAAMPVTGVRITEGVILQVMGHGMSDWGTYGQVSDTGVSPMTMDGGSGS